MAGLCRNIHLLLFVYVLEPECSIFIQTKKTFEWLPTIDTFVSKERPHPQTG
jgi:hypothetical protein